jgi:hypothetical protein
MVFLFYDLLGIIVGAIDALFFSKANTVAAFASRMLLWEVVIGIGFLGIMCFLGHVLASEKVAEYIGWQSNYFQKELGFAELGMGVIAIMSLWRKSQFIDCSIIVALTTCIGATYVRITDLTKNKNLTRGNILSLLPDLFIPLSLITLKILSNI